MIKNLNFILILATIMVLAAIGIIFIFGTGFSWVKSIDVPEWRQTAAYREYLDNMNLAVAPLAVALVIVLGLCIPKRLFSGKALLQIMGALLAASVIMGAVSNLTIGMGFLLGTAMILQLLVIVLTITGSKQLSYESQGFYVQTGSAFLHLGLILFIFDFVLLGESSRHIPIFWVATAFIGIGMILAFYSEELSKAISRPSIDH